MTHDSTPTPTVRLDQISKSFRRTTALDGLTLDLHPGVVGLLGPNGAGKTTLLRVLATVLAPDSGSSRLLGRDPEVASERTQVRRRLGYLPQELGYPRGFTAHAFVDYLAVLKEWDDARARRTEVNRVLDLVGLADLGSKRIRTLSGGQRRRLGLAQALIGSPELLVLDEPTTGLDPEQRVSLRHVFAEAGRRSTIVVSTHQTEDVAALCERVVVLDRGRVQFDGEVRALVRLAHGRVWLAGEPDSTAQASWRTATGLYRNLGRTVPRGAVPADPTLEDAYLLLRGTTPTEDAGRAA